MNAAPVKKRRSTALVVWTIPLLALLLAGWMLYKFYSDRGGEIVVSFNDGSGLLERKTLLKYKGIVLGHITKIELHPDDVSRVNVTFNVPKRALKAIAREGNEFWKVKPRVTLTEVSGLETIVGGLYVEIYPAKQSYYELIKLPEKYYFEAADHKPEDHLQPGLKLYLEDTTGAFAVDTPIVYKKFIVGRVIERDLIEDKVRYTVHIDEEYKNLIRQTSNFWGISSVDLKATMAGVKLKVDSLATLIAGGITFDSPSDAPEVNASRKHPATFSLYANQDEIDYDPRVITLQTQDSYSMEAELNEVYFKGVEAGKIVSVRYLPKKDMTQYRIKLKKSFMPLVKQGAYFWAVAPKFSFKGVSGLDAITRGTYIAFAPKEGDAHDVYSLHDAPLPKKGVKISLHTDDSSGLFSGSPVFYKNFEAGMISKIALDDTKQGVDIEAVIDPKYATLINASSLFYKHAAIEAEVSFSKLSVKAATLPQIIEGGIIFKTLHPNETSTQHHFKLLNSAHELEKAQYYLNGGTHVSLLAQNARGVRAEMPLYYNQFKAGEVVNVDYNATNEQIKVDMYIDKRFEDRLTSSSRFYKLSGAELKVSFPEINLKVDSLQALLEGGIAFDNADGNKTAPLQLYESRDEAFDNDYRAKLYLESDTGLRVGSSIVYKGITIGSVESLNLEGQRLVALMRIDKAHEALMSADAIISLEDFSIDMNGVKNAATLVSGPSLHVTPGSLKQLGNTYTLKNIICYQNQLRKGLRIVVSADRRSSLKVGSPLFYRQVQIGDVEEVRLSDNATQVEFSLFIEPCYAHLIRENSLFYNASALGMELSLTGVKINTETVETMIAGGIAVVTPNGFGDVAKAMRVFKLYDKPKAEWLEWYPSLSSSNPMCQ